MSDSSYKSQVAATWGSTRQATCRPCWKFVETFLFFTTLTQSLSFQRALLMRVEKKEILQSCILFFVSSNKRPKPATWCTSGHLMLGRGRGGWRGGLYNVHSQLGKNLPNPSIGRSLHYFCLLYECWIRGTLLPSWLQKRNARGMDRRHWIVGPLP